MIKRTELNALAFDTLLEFYEKYNNWLNIGAPDNEPFTRCFGLCYNLVCADWNPSTIDYALPSYKKLNIKKSAHKLMKHQFIDAGLSVAYPFGGTSYIMSRANDSQHLDSARIEWVEEKLAEMNIEKDNAEEVLLDFYKDYKAWLDNGADDGYPYTRSAGLCWNLTHSDLRLRLDVSEASVFEASNLMRKQFEEAGLDNIFPFGNRTYSDGILNNNQHLDPKRIKWVEDKIVEMESKS